MNINTIKSLLRGILIMTVVFGLAFVLSHDTATMRRQKQINEALTKENTQFKVRDSLNAVEAVRLGLELSEYKSIHEEDLKVIKDLKISKKALEAELALKVNTDKEVDIPLRDSVRVDTFMQYVDTVRLKAFNYMDRWTSINGYIEEDSLHINIHNEEAIKIYQYYERKRFLFFKLPVKWFGYRSKRAKAVSENPNTKVTSLQIIDIIQ